MMMPSFRHTISKRTTIEHGGCRSSSSRSARVLLVLVRSFIDSPIKHVGDRGIDHAVMREHPLKPILNIKELVKSEPSKTISLSHLNAHRHSLQIPYRPIDFIRHYPSVFQSFSPNNNTSLQPHIKLTPQLLDIDAQEILLYQSYDYKQKLADRLLKLLMIGRVNKIPLGIVDRLRWDLGLPNDYVHTVIPEFPDYFRVSRKGELELVCWIAELGTSLMEKRGLGAEFPLRFSTGFEMDNKYKKWLDDWQKLPYVSPYENGLHFHPRSDKSDKWVVGVMHEILNLTITKKTERDNMLSIGESLGVRARFKRALLHHPGIFYLSSKTGAYTVVLKEAFKRGMLIESDSLTSVRSRYLHLMHTEEEEPKGVSESGGRAQQVGVSPSDAEAKDDSDDDFDNDEEDVTDSDEEDENEHKTGAHNRETHNKRGRSTRTAKLDVKKPTRSSTREKSAGQRNRKLWLRTAKDGTIIYTE